MWLGVVSGPAGGEAVELGDEPVTIGSGEGCRLRVPDAEVAPLHASVRREDDGSFHLVALAETPAVLVDGEPLGEGTTLREGSELRVGGTELAVRPRLEDFAEAERHRHRLDEGVEEVEGPHEEAPPVRGLRDRIRLATALGAAGIVLAAVLGGLALSGALGGGGGGGLTTEQVVAAGRSSTVRIQAVVPHGLSQGTGWVLDARRRLVVTNFHVIDGGRTFTVVGPKGGGASATVVAAAPCDDVAVLRLDDDLGLRTLPQGSQRSLERGAPVTALGYPANAGNAPTLTSTAGVVSVPRLPLDVPGGRAPTLPDVVQTDAALNPGNSGGPLLDDHARLVGMNAATLTAAGGEPIQGQGYAIGVDRLRALLPGLSGGHSRGWSGLSLTVPPPGLLRREHLPAGMIVGPAIPGTAADRAGFGAAQVLLVSVAGHRVGSGFPSYCQAVSSLHGTAMARVIARPGGRVDTVRLPFS